MGKPVLHQHAFWVYGVIVGLAIKEALTAVLPHLLVFFSVPPESPFAYLAQTWKLIIFIVVIIRFYLGSAIFFHDYHTVETEPLTGGYITDFLSGIVHFILFFGWSLTFGVVPTVDQQFRPTAYETLLGVILLYDFLWLVLCRGTAGASRVRSWAWINFVTVMLAAIIHLVSGAANADIAMSESLALIPVLLISIADLGHMASGTDLGERIAKVFRS
jgi:hypothetical protein